MTGLPMWQLIAGGGAVLVAGFALWYVVRLIKASGYTEAQLHNSEKARELQTELNEIGSKRYTAEEVIERIKNKQFGGPKP